MLHHAAANGSLSILVVVIASNRYINYRIVNNRGQKPLHIASMTDEAVFVEKLIHKMTKEVYKSKYPLDVWLRTDRFKL